MSLKKILIIANGEFPDDEKIQSLIDDSVIIIAADGGSNRCLEMDLRPDYIVGDLDSISPEAVKAFEGIPIIERPDQDRHDLDKSLEYCLQFDPDEIHVLGAFGGRTDHTVANLLLLQFWRKSCPLWFYDKHGSMTVLQGDTNFFLTRGTLISLFSFTPVQGLTLEGFRYRLDDADFPSGFNGLSNVVESPQVRISVRFGQLLMYLAEHEY